LLIMENSEFEKKLDDLSKNLSLAPARPAPVYGETGSSRAETIKFLQDKLAGTQAEYEGLLTLKNSTINDLTNQIEAMRAHIEEVKQHYDAAREELLQEQMLQAVKLEETDKLMKDQKTNHQKEIKLLSEILERSKYEIKTLDEKNENLRRERDELKGKTRKAEMEKMDLSDRVSARENGLSESKKAVEETLGRLLEERKLHNDSKRRIKELEGKISELSGEIENAKLNWTAERKEWRELWDRERSVWETHRQEFAVWEERLRSEREAWLSRLRQEEEKGVNSAQSITKILEDTSKWSEKVTQVLKLYATKGVQLPHVFVTPEVVAKRTVSSFRRVFALGALAVMAFGVLSWWVYDYKTKVHFSLSAERTLEDSNYTSLFSEGESLFLAHWNRGLVVKNGKFENSGALETFSGQEAKISAVSCGGGFMWLLDMAQLRFLKADPKTGEIIQSYKTAGPAPQGLAYDGFNLWAFDASTGLLYKYSLNGGVQGIITYNLKGVKTVNAMQWTGEKLAVLSDGYLIRYNFKNDVFDRFSSQKLKNAVAFYFEGEKMTALEKSGSINKVVEYRVKK